MISFVNVEKVYPDGTRAVKSLDMTINEGEFFVLIGPSGCGKTTTLKMINRLNETSDGKILIRDKSIHDYNIHELRRNIGYVLQQIALFPHMTIEENISIVPELKGWDKKKVKARVTELLELVGLDPEQYRNRKPSELSGGQQQRIGVARALAADPPVILMDEPFSALDPISREQLQKDIVALQAKIKKTIVFVTHDMNEALTLGDRVCLMKDGHVVQIGTPEELVNDPANDFVESFLGNRQNVWATNVIEVVKKFRDRMQTIPEATTAEIKSNATIEEAYELLHHHSALRVLRRNEEIGIVTSSMILEFLYDHSKEGGFIGS
ncbi:ABC transporter ATP-binding protein [Priestia koreensis]|uniref:Quaternary amine transport ATP-binding protein n=1 Tax=Priestia koreensis TaxID=284581 RepID=A0A0M0LI48_9BACI|nr:ABC transporter ATP-binding protein [Priestia koreensis]KOO50651.1 glycine/betaine ABC transporter ATP-binding protein [Priestia koreensis]